MSIQLKSKLDNTSPVHIQYDLSILNNDVEGDSPPVPLKFEEVRNNPFLMSPENYYLSVIRFQIQTGDSLPVFVPMVQLGQSNPNKTIYSITLKWKNYEYQSYLMYIPDDASAPTPNPPLTAIDFSSQYYYLSCYQPFIQMVNNTFQQAYTGLNALVVAGGEVLPSSNPPFMEIDPSALVCTLNADVLGYDRNLANPIQIYMNSPMYNLFSTFPSTLINYTGLSVANGKNYLITMYNNNNLNVLNLPSYNCIQSYQEGSSVALWNPIESIVFTTSLLPIVPSNVSQPKIFGSASNLYNTGNNSNISPQITDLVVPVDALNRYRPNIVYTPSSEYRMVDLYGSTPVSAIELSAFWKDVFGNLHPLYLNSGCSASIKILFRRKDFNNITLF